MTIRRTSRTTGPRLATTLTAAILSATVGATVAVAASPASAAASHGYVQGSGSFRNDWSDEGTVTTDNRYTQSNVTCLWQKILVAEGLLKESKINGVFSRETMIATKKLQSRWHTTANGKADGRTFHHAAAPNRLRYVSGSTAGGKRLVLKYDGASKDFEVRRDEKGVYLFYADGGWKAAAYKYRSCR